MTTALIILGIIIGLILILALIAGKEMVIEKNITIEKSSKEIFDFVKFSKNHDKFSVWNQMDPDMKREYRGTDGTVGFVFVWDSQKDRNVGAGEQETKKIDEGKSIEYELRFSRPMQNVAKTKFIFKPTSSNQTNVQWGFYSATKFPMSIMKPIFQMVLGKDLKKGLEQLKTVLEK